MAVIYVSKLQLKALALQTESSESLDVEVIGFSTFNKTLTQKKHIKATLYEEPIELHSKEDDAFYTVRKIKAHDGFNFDRGNSGSPVICKNSGAVIAMVSNKEGSELAYAIDIENLKTVWKDVPLKLFDNIIPTNPTPRPNSSPKPSPNPNPNPNPNPSSPMKYIVTLLILLALGLVIYNWMKTPHPKDPTQKNPPHKTVSTINNAATLEKVAFSALIQRDYKQATELFNKGAKEYPKYHNFYEISRLLNKHLPRMNEPLIRNLVLRRITKDFNWGVPKEVIGKLRRQIKN